MKTLSTQVEVKQAWSPILTRSLGLAALVVIAEPTMAGDYFRPARVCDPSGCYLAWNIVDSDRDGICDADELIAGTDPYDPLSRPSLDVIADLGGKSELPSYEAGLGAFFVFPTEIQTLIQANKDNPLVAFPLYQGRADSLSRLGISTELLNEHGIDLTKDGFTIGLGANSKGDSQEPGVGHIRQSWYSEGDEDPNPLPTHVDHGEVVKIEFEPGGDVIETYGDGCVKASRSDGSGTVLDKDGKIVGVWYVDPEAEQTNLPPTPEQEANRLRLRGAAIRTVEGWSAPDPDGATPSDPLVPIILINPEYVDDTVLVFTPSQVAKPQPEKRDDLPSPGVPANPIGCNIGC